MGGADPTPRGGRTTAQCGPLVVEALSRDPTGSRTGDGFRGTTVGQVLSPETSFVSRTYAFWTRVRFPPPPPFLQRKQLLMWLFFRLRHSGAAIWTSCSRAPANSIRQSEPLSTTPPTITARGTTLCSSSMGISKGLRSSTMKSARFSASREPSLCARPSWRAAFRV